MLKLNTALKYWIFRYLKCLASSAMVTCRNMNE
ncbi:hypothetical protein [Picosynechococcus sp. PCC 8807]|nr:hypothetical protein [Picosynechococcus sp. PCC 8807]